MKGLQDLLEDTLRKEGLTEEAGNLARILKQQVFTWKMEDLGDPGDATTIIGFSFGYVLDKNGNRCPGRINQQLADRIVQYCIDRRRKVYVQWEIAEAIGSRLPGIVSIGPDIDEKKGEVKYLNTKDVLRKVKEQTEGQNKGNIGPILVVAHSLHLLRCVTMVQKQGFSVRVDQANMPTEFDPASAQPWTRNLRIYIISEIISRLDNFRNEELCKK